MDALMTHHGAVDVAHAGGGLVLVVVHVTVDPDLDRVRAVVVETVMTSEEVAVMTIVEARRRASPGPVVAVIVVKEAAIEVVIEAVLAARAQETMLQTDLQQQKKNHQLTQTGEIMTKKTTDMQIVAMTITITGDLPHVLDLVRVPDLDQRTEIF